MSDCEKIRIAKILVKKTLGTISPAEEEELLHWIKSSEENRTLYEDFISGKSYSERRKNFSHLKYESTIAAIRAKINQRERRRLFIRISSVAAVFLVAILCVLSIPMLRNGGVRFDELPVGQGKFFAIMSVDEGEKVILKERETGTEWLKHVEAKRSEKTIEEETEVRMVRVEVPRGSEYRLRLNDSTEVWLNSETILTYPEKFVGKEREVFLRGEAFFDVKSNPDRPFVVRTNEELQIRVMGTQLNVRNYADELFLKVTLLKGIVCVGNDSVYKVLSPSEQAVFNRETGDVQVVLLEDSSTCVAWREGMFAFESESMEVILNAMAQWYDVEFIFENRYMMPSGKVTFHAMRDEKVEDLLGVLQNLIDFRYKVEGKKIYINF